MSLHIVTMKRDVQYRVSRIVCSKKSDLGRSWSNFLTHLGRCMKRHVVSLRGSGTRSQFCHFSRLNRFKLFALWYQKAPRNSWCSIQDVCLLPHTLCETKVSYYYNRPTDVAIFVSRWHSGGVNYGPPLDVDSRLLLLVKENHHNPNLAFQVM